MILPHYMYIGMKYSFQTKVFKISFRHIINKAKIHYYGRISSVKKTSKVKILICL